MWVQEKASCKLFLFISLLICFCVACKQRIIEPVIPAGERVVLIEEFTGKGCTNCPKGSRELENLLSFYQDQLVVVSIHANHFANPANFPIGQYDLRTDEGEALFDYLGPILAFPTATINRHRFNNQLQHGANSWAGYVAQEVAIAPEIEFTTARVYVPLARTLSIVVEGRAKVDIPREVRISAMLTESGIVDAQDDSEQGGVVQDYVHNHVLRDMLTPYDGRVLASAMTAAEEFQQAFEYTLPAEFVADACSVIIFISIDDGGDLTVLQAGEVHVID